MITVMPAERNRIATIPDIRLARRHFSLAVRIAAIAAPGPGTSP
jgi:hypothetical protein